MTETLSDKNMVTVDKLIDLLNPILKGKDRIGFQELLLDWLNNEKQFIKDLKEEFKKRSWKAWSWRDIEIVIDKLAGDKLTSLEENGK